MPDTTLPYLDAFPPGTEADWRTRVSAVLKGKGAETLIARSYDGIPIEPLYPPADRMPVPRAQAPWALLARADDPDAGSANVQALDDLGNGADGLHLVTTGALGDFGTGLSSADAPWASLLRGVVLDAEIPIEVDSMTGPEGAADSLAAHVAATGADPKATRISFGIDPFGALARHGKLFGEADVLSDRVAAWTAQGFAGPFLVADARLIHAAGGSEAQELGYVLASAVASLRLLEAGGVALDAARRAISFRFAVDADEFLGIAKLRALRRLWASVETQCGLEPVPAHLHAETAWRMMTRRDADVNMIRATLAVFAAGVGGADRISVLPHTQAHGLPDAFARRVARNTALVLGAEANLAKVADPAAGAGGFEAMTDALCERGWAEFARIEAAGGLAAALTSGSLRDAVAATADARRRNIARRKDGITGVSEFPAIGEAPLRPVTPAGGPFAPRRLAEPFEALRDRSDEILQRTGARPKVFLATLGPVAAHSARATFAKNLFEAGGFETVAHGGADTDAALVDDFARSGARIACLCSSDALYAERAPAAAAALAPNAARLVLAGRPGEAEATLRAAGVTDFAYAGADVVALLETLSRAT